MDKSAIRNYAVWARKALIEAVTQKAYEYEIKDGVEPNGTLEVIDGRLLSAEELRWRKKLVEEIKKKGFLQVMEEAAYTWFNRFIALRYMEVNGFIPTRVRVFTNEAGEFKPDILKEAMTIELEGLKREKVIDLIEKQNNEELFKYLIITQCNALNQGLPYMFEKISNWTELLFPANLLRTDSIIGRMVNEIPEEDWQDAVQIIGWMYQFYNIEPKAKVFSKAGGAKITKEEIPAATQLFTPEWIVKYMVENSLGRIYINYELGMRSEELSEQERIDQEKEIAERMGWKYYLPEAEQEPDVRKQLLAANSSFLTDYDVKNIKIIDPCMGSGHILVYAFDVLMQIYIAAGYSERDAAKSILENNLYGLDIDDRAGQLAYFAVMMKARKYSRRILNSGIAPHVFSIQDSSFMSDDFIAFVANKDHESELDLIGIRNAFVDAKEYGSVLSVPKFDYEKLYARIEELKTYFPQTIFESEYRITAIEKLYQIVKQAEMLHQKYDVTVTNPPYMAVSAAGPKLNSYIVKNFPDSKTDMFAVFIERCGQMLKKNGYQAMITMHSWMFLSSYEKLRSKLLSKDTINMAHLGARAFEEIGGEVVQTTAFVFRNTCNLSYKGIYCRLIEPNTQKGKENLFLLGENRYKADQSNFSKIPGSPIAYWVSETIIEAFQKMSIGDYGYPKQGFATGDNNRFLRLWHEVNFKKVNFSCTSLEESNTASYKWYPCNKGGEFRRWYGNNYYLANWENDGREMRNFKGSVIRNPQFYFRRGITWSSLSSGGLSMRYSPKGFIFESKGSVCFLKDDINLKYLLGLTNSKIVDEMLLILSPTLDYHEGPMSKVPVIMEENKKNLIDSIVEENVSFGKQDWDSFETSWDFKKHPLV